MWRLIWVCCCLLASGLAGADEMSAVELASVPESIEINGVVLKGSGYLYFNEFPGGVELPVDCQRDGRFIVIVTVHVQDSNLRKQLSAERIWVIQGERMWNGRVLETRLRQWSDQVDFISRDCNTPIVPVRYPLRDQFDLDNAIRAKTIIELEYVGKRHLLRLPDAVVGVAS